MSMSQTLPGILLTIEGIEGVGKTTAVKYIQTFLTDAKQDHVVTREPGGTLIAEQIRQILLTPNADEVLVPDTELLLMFACRTQHIHHFVIPKLQAGNIVISDRFLDASYAYQGGGREFGHDKIKALDDLFVGNLVVPQVTILLDAPANIGITRAKNRGPQDRIESEQIDFFERVRQAYLQRAVQFPQRFHVINAAEPLAKVHANIGRVLTKLLMDNGRHE
jgi:dTMP kinase